MTKYYLVTFLKHPSSVHLKCLKAISECVKLNDDFDERKCN